VTLPALMSAAPGVYIVVSALGSSKAPSPLELHDKLLKSAALGSEADVLWSKSSPWQMASSLPASAVGPGVSVHFQKPLPLAVRVSVTLPALMSDRLLKSVALGNVVDVPRSKSSPWQMASSLPALAVGPKCQHHGI
jgi:hypothetical protein